MIHGTRLQAASRPWGTWEEAVQRGVDQRQHHRPHHEVNDHPQPKGRAKISQEHGAEHRGDVHRREAHQWSNPHENGHQQGAHQATKDGLPDIQANRTVIYFSANHFLSLFFLPISNCELLRFSPRFLASGARQR